MILAWFSLQPITESQNKVYEIQFPTPVAFFYYVVYVKSMFVFDG